MNKKSLLFVALAAVLSLSACGGGDEAEDEPSVVDNTPTDGSQSMAQLAGYGRACVILTSAGSALNGKAMDRYLRLYADGTYSFSTNITDATACQYGSSDGTGYNVIATQLNISGTYTLGGTNTTPSTATRITFRPTSQTFTIYNAAAPSGVKNTARLMADWANNCSSWGGTYATSGTSGSSTFDPLTCNPLAGVGGSSFGRPVDINTDQYNVIYRYGGEYQTAEPMDFWSPNAGSFSTAPYATTWE